MSREHVTGWIERLWSIERARVNEALERVDGWRIPHLRNVLTGETADGALGAYFLVESFDYLVQAGIPTSTLLSKLRGDPNVWPTWAEIRAGGLLVHFSEEGTEIIAEPGKRSGRQPDYALRYASGDTTSVEVKTIGLSDQEAAFSERVTPLLEGLTPRHGICTMHLEDTDVDVQLNRSARRHQMQEAERRAKYLPAAAQQIAAAVIVGHGTAESYAWRLAARLREAFAQLPAEQGCVVVFHWSNGAPTSMIRRALARVVVPENLVGVILVGTVATSASIENYVVLLPGPFDIETREEEWRTDAPLEYAQTIFNRAEDSSGARVTLMRSPDQRGRLQEFLRRSGSQRVFPFNLVLVPDPPDLLPPRDAVNDALNSQAGTNDYAPEGGG